MRVLALDTSTDLGSVAVLVEGRLVAEVAARVRSRHGEVLLPHVARALELAALEPRELDLLAVGLGPGSFTGLRIGLSVVKGLALATGVPAVGVPSLDALARAADGAEAIVAVSDGQRGEVFAAAYARTRLGDVEVRLAPTHGEPEAVGRRARSALGHGVAAALVGEGLDRHGEAFERGLGAPARRLPAVLASPRAALVGLAGLERLRAHGADDLAALEPLYVRDADATPPSG